MPSSDFLPAISRSSFSYCLRLTLRCLLFLTDIHMQTLTCIPWSFISSAPRMAEYFIKELTGSPELPGHPLHTRHSRTPRRLRCNPTLLSYCAVAFRPVATLGSRNESYFVAAFPRLACLRTYASQMPLPTPAQGSLPTCRVWLWSDGFRTRWMTHPIF